jgi:glycosyltransferase 2 family protein
MRKYRTRFFIGLVLARGLYRVYLVVIDSRVQLEGTAGIGETLALFDWRLLPILILSQCAVILFRFIEWQLYMGVVGARQKMSLADSAIIFVAGFMLVISPGKAAELLKAVFVRAKSGVPAARVAPAVIAERVVDGLAVILLMMVTLVLAGDSLNLGTYGGVDYNLVSRTIVFSSAAVLLFGLVAVQIQPLAYFCLNLIARLPLIKRIHQPLVAFYESSREIFYWKTVLAALIPGTGVFLASSLCFLAVLSGFGLPITGTLVLQATFIVGVTSAVGALSFVPNGAGVTEAGSTVLLLAMLAPADPVMTPAVAAAASLIQGFFHKWFRVLVGLVVAVIFSGRLFAGDVDTLLDEAGAEEGRTVPVAEV